MSTGSRRETPTNDVESHEFAGGESAESLTDEAQQKADRITEARDLDDAITFQLDKILRDLEGNLVATCSCGSRSLDQPWIAPSMKTRDGSYTFASHQGQMRISRASQMFAASCAAAALRHAAEDWTGDSSGTRWMDARAEHIASTGRYDSEQWPTA